MSKKLRLSYTKLSFYLACPKRYYYRYEEKRPFYPSMMAKYGSNIHRAIKDFSEVIRTEGDIDEKIQADILEKQWSDVSKDSVVNIQLKSQGMQQLQEFVDNNAKELSNTIFLEKSFSFPLNSDITLCGYIDRIDRLDENLVEIIDYKSGMVRKLYADDLQLNFYALVCRDYLNLTPAKLSLYFLRSNTKESVNSSNIYIDITRNLIEEIAHKISSEDFIPAEESLQHCYECSYNRICPYARKGIN